MQQGSCIKFGITAALVGLPFLLGCGNRDTADKMGEQMEKAGEEAKETMDQLDNEGILEEAAEEMDQFAEDTKESIGVWGEKIKEKFNRMELEARIDRIVENSREKLQEAKGQAKESATNIEDRAKKITAESKEKIQALLDSVKAL